MKFDLFKLKTFHNIDPFKKNVIIIDKDKDGEFTHINGAGKLIKEKLERDFNVFTFWLNGTYKGDKPNQYVYMGGDKKYLDLYHRKDENVQNFRKKNSIHFLSTFDFIGGLPEFEFLFIASNTTLTMPMRPYCSKGFDETLYLNKSEYFDYIGDDENVIQKINEINDKLFKWDYPELLAKLSPYAITTRMYIHIFTFIRKLYESNKIRKVVSLISDPNFSRNYFQYHNIPFDFYYYVHDHRGTRSFKKLPVSELQQIYSERFGAWEDSKKDMNVLFAGTIFHEKGPRTEIWDEFLSGFTDVKSSFFIPIKKNGIIKRKENNKQITYVKERFEQTYNEVINHVCTKPFYPPDKLEDEISRYRFGLVFRCVSVYDSVNPKPFQYLTKGVLPLFDYKYDEEYLLIPKEIKDKITFKNSEELQKLISMSESERLNFIEELKLIYEYEAFENNRQELIESEYRKILNNI